MVATEREERWVGPEEADQGWGYPGSEEKQPKEEMRQVVSQCPPL
jgi:hypothetical protein